MRGEVTAFDGVQRTGNIAGDDGIAYAFDAAAVRSAGQPAVGQRVDFVAAGGWATEIIALAAPVGSGTATLSGASSEVHGRFDLGRVIQRTFSSIRQNWKVFLVLSSLLVGVPSLIQAFGQGTMLGSQNVGGWVAAAIGWVLAIIGAYMLQGIVVKVTVNGLNGKTMSLGTALEAGIRLFLPLLGLAIIAGLGTLLGFILLIVPGVILAILWSAAAPSVVVEGRGIFESLQRSRDLTRGYRWPIFGLMVIYFIAAMVIGMLVSGVSLATGAGIGATSGAGLGEIGPMLFVNMIAAGISSIVTGVISAAGVGALYYELRSVKEGVGPEQLASVFD